MALLVSALSVCLTGCLHPNPKVKVIDPYSTVTRLPAGTNWVAPVNGYFIPDARMHQLLDVLSERELR